MTEKSADMTIRQLVSAMVKSYSEDPVTIKIEAKNQIHKVIVLETIEKLQWLLFPGFFNQKPLKSDSVEYYVGELLEDVAYHLQKQISRALCHQRGREDCGQETIQEEAARITSAFLERLPDLRRVLATDVEAAYEGDPAAFSKDEVIFSYPCIYTIMVARLAHELYELGVPLIPRMMTEHAHSLTGIDIHPGATMGHHFFMDHGTGIVIGETTIIGNYVKVYQGVTLGALSTRGGQSLRNTKRHPTIEDHVTIYSGASIFGGNTVIGEEAVIGSNAFITKSVPAKTKVSVKNPELKFKTEEQVQSVELTQGEPWDFIV